MKKKNALNIIKQITDIHVHYGPHGEHEFSPQEVLEKMKRAGFKRMAIMPSPERYDEAIPNNHRVLDIMNQTDIEVIPILLTSPAMIKNDPVFKNVKDIPYKIIKIHPFAHQWHLYPKLVEIIIFHAKTKGLPVMVHTGYDESDPKNFEKWVIKYPEVNFIFAHGKPAEQAAKMLQKYQNTWVDISFMEIEGIKLLLKNNSNANQPILFGTDAPITELFYNLTTEEYCFNRINELVECFGEETLLLWGNSNVNALI